MTRKFFSLATAIASKLILANALLQSSYIMIPLKVDVYTEGSLHG